jgi:hypothetical protein
MVGDGHSLTGLKNTWCSVEHLLSRCFSSSVLRVILGERLTLSACHFEFPPGGVGRTLGLVGWQATAITNLSATFFLLHQILQRPIGLVMTVVSMSFDLQTLFLLETAAISSSLENFRSSAMSKQLLTTSTQTSDIIHLFQHGWSVITPWKQSRMSEGSIFFFGRVRDGAF